MQDAHGVRGHQRIGRLPNDLCRAHRVEPPFAVENFREGFTRHIFHGQVHRPVGRLSEVVYLRDVGVGNLRRVLGLTMEARHRQRVARHPLPHELDRHFALHAHVFGQKHLAHATFAQPFLHQVTLGQHRPDQGV